MEHWKIWASAAAAVALVGFAYVISPGRDSIPTVQIFHPVRASLVDSITSNGKIEPVDPHVFRAQYETFVTGVFAKEGQTVHRGEKLLTLDAKQVQSDLAETRMKLLKAQEELRNARAGGPPDERADLTGELRRARVDVEHLQKRQDILQKLFDSHASTQDEVNQNSSALERARVLLETLEQKQKDFSDRVSLGEKSALLATQQGEEKVQLLESKLRSATVVSDIEGTLYSFPLRAGDFVRAGDALAEMADLRRVRLRAFVDETDLGELKLGQPVRITWDAMPEKSWSGKTIQIPQQVLARGTRSIGEVLCSVDNDKLELLPNVNVDVRILVQQNNNALVVPRGAVRSEQGKHFVLVVDADRLRRREVRLGMSNASNYEIISGLDENDQVALSSNLELHDGTKVRVAPTK